MKITFENLKDGDYFRDEDQHLMLKLSSNKAEKVEYSESYRFICLVDSDEPVFKL